jgi:vesicle coat complex subunit
MQTVMAEVIKNDNADVRKSAVFCLVEMHTVIGDELFE